MKAKARKVLAGLGAVGGVVLIGLELFNQHPREAAGISWFWVAVGVGLVVFGVLELIAPRQPLE